MDSSSVAGWLANLVLVAHFCFVAFVVLGGLLVIAYPRLAFAHVPAVLWGVLIEFAGWICPLTPLENALRRRAGESGYEGDFIAHYVTALIYPVGLTRATQIVLGSLALAFNAAVYAVVWRRLRCRTAATTKDTSGASSTRRP
ncbi:MAG TPA: DUF2784 domain-containing protein [Blastocatellia bacterium]|nr:DUF2784 domain-containing protein [Blastocatellia bacterium]